MSLSLRDKIFLLALYDLPVNVLFSQPSLVDGYVVTPCAESGSPIATRDGEHIPEVCDRPSYLKFDRFPLACLAVSLRQGGFRTIHHGDRLSLVVNNTPTLRYILPADAEAGFWIPRRLSDRKRFNSERMVRSRRHITMRPPAWHGDERPHGARGVRVRSNFPSPGYIRHLVSDLAYDGEAAMATLPRAHNPWVHPPADRRKSACNDLMGLDKSGRQYNHAELRQPAHPYRPDSPSRRTKTGGGLTKEQVQKGLQKMRTEGNRKAALIEIVYRRRSTLRVSEEFNLPAETLYVYASRLRGHIRGMDAGAVLHVGENLS